ncbi:DUF4142 domain-containing protein [Burkholderia gladioli]|uniref:DUF4142 domain-containing protein n=1 Tax=Burkholderia gladioli TaxID=28095 RepID=UPI001642188B|nr:DUF4142 domain-containing protein [Burkholderia gladioli]MDA0569510.1 DUF4142 domain-containing protein [Burkholderia gladioli]MDA0597998.1 DUF4142 domain-containing protein [Burkholderia gladioli]
MHRRSLVSLCCSAAVALLTSGLAPLAAHAAGGATSDADRAFVAMVSQGGMFEVAAGKVAARQGARQDIVDLGSTEAHDHQLVGAKLPAAAGAAGIEVDTQLNAAFTQRLDKLRGLSGTAFDDAFIAEMKTIHAADGGDPGLRAFAAEAVRIVKRHQGALHALPPENG